MPQQLLCAVALVGLLVGPALAQGTGQSPAGFAADIQAFRQWDAKNATPPNGIVFVGSSTIVLWPTAMAFPALPVINRGFGGSQIFESTHYADDLVIKHAPRVVVFYAGDNDINAGKNAQQVLDDYRAFTRRVLAARPSTTIVFLAIKPSVARWKHWPTMKEANERIASYSAGYSKGAVRGSLQFVDVATPMLGPGGTMPAASLFIEDGLHMSPAGYALWNKILTPVLTDLMAAAR